MAQRPVANVNRPILAMVLTLFLGAHALFAQHRRGRGGDAGQPTSNPGIQPDTGDSDTQVFRRVLELQATQDQASQYRSMARKTESAQKQMRELAESAAKTKLDDSEALKAQLNLLELAMDDVRQGDKEFLGSFSDPQKSGLKKFTKAARKAESEATRPWKKLTKELAGPAPDGNKVADLAGQVRDALASLEVEQKKLGSEMGIDVSTPVNVPTPVLVSP